MLLLFLAMGGSMVQPPVVFGPESAISERHFPRFTQLTSNSMCGSNVITAVLYNVVGAAPRIDYIGIAGKSVDADTINSINRIVEGFPISIQVFECGNIPNNFETTFSYVSMNDDASLESKYFSLDKDLRLSQRQLSGR